MLGFAERKSAFCAQFGFCSSAITRASALHYDNGLGGKPINAHFIRTYTHTNTHKHQITIRTTRANTRNCTAKRANAPRDHHHEYYIRYNAKLLAVWTKVWCRAFYGCTRFMAYTHSPSERDRNTLERERTNEKRRRDTHTKTDTQIHDNRQAYACKR